MPSLPPGLLPSLIQGLLPAVKQGDIAGTQAARKLSTALLFAGAPLAAQQLLSYLPCMRPRPCTTITFGAMACWRACCPG